MYARQFKFTVADIAQASGTTEAQVRYAIRSGALDPHSLESLSIYVVKEILDRKCSQQK